MSSYILSTANRFYAGIEGSFGNATAIAAQNRFVASRVNAMQVVSPSIRRDKNGSRTCFSPGTHGFRTTAFEALSYLTSNSALGTPSCGVLFQSALGGAPQVSSGLIVGNAPDGSTVQTTKAHGLAVGSAISYAGEIRFVTAVQNATTVNVNAPFSNIPPAGAALPTAATYGVALTLPSLTIYDYWDPADAVSRIITGATVNNFELSISGGAHEFSFSGPASNLIDSVSFRGGTAGLSAFPAEPPSGQFDYSFVSGNLGQAWLGTNVAPFFTLTDVHLRIVNNLQARSGEFGSSHPLAFVPGRRQVTVDFTLVAQDDAQTTALYQIAKQRGTISALLQLGQQHGEMMAIYLPSVTPQIPSFDDSCQRLVWHFANNKAGGVIENEIFVAFV